jgi:pyrroline-5-carboxylate reductase
MAEAMVRGILDKGTVRPEDITASDISRERRTLLEKDYSIRTVPDNRAAASEAEVVVLAIKPQSLNQVIEELKGQLQPGQLVLSIVAGASTARISQGLGHRAVARAMPNMPAQIGEGISVWTATGETSQEQREKARSLLTGLGTEVFVPQEDYIDMATAVSGSGPAYVFEVIEALIDAAVHIGLPRELAGELVLHTISGAVHLTQQTGKHPAELRNQVASPGGTTVEGLLQLEAGGLRALFARAIIAGYKKAKSLEGKA